jgi:para-aminobenzoate synthetase component 1
MSIGTINRDTAEKIYRDILQSTLSDAARQLLVRVNSRFSKETYIQAIQQLKLHIKKGDCYEINFCQDVFADDVVLVSSQQ